MTEYEARQIKEVADRIFSAIIDALSLPIDTKIAAAAVTVTTALRAYGDRRVADALAGQICGSCDGQFPNDNCPHATNAAHANEPSPCHPRAAEAASPAVGWLKTAQILPVGSEVLFCPVCGHVQPSPPTTERDARGG